MQVAEERLGIVIFIFLFPLPLAQKTTFELGTKNINILTNT
jgi:hypothetical protein